MNSRRSATVAAAFYPAVVVAGWAFLSLTGIGSPRIESSAAAHVVNRLAPALTANADFAAAPQPTTMSYAAPGNADVATAAEFMAKPVTEAAAAPAEPQSIVVAALTDPATAVAGSHRHGLRFPLAIAA